MKNEQQIEAYKKMAKEAASVGMEARRSQDKSEPRKDLR